MLSLKFSRILGILSVCLVGILFVSPNFFHKNAVESWPNWLPKNQVRLGLDLRGGSRLLLEVGVDEVLTEHFDMLEEQLSNALIDGGANYSSIEYTNTGEHSYVLEVVPENPKNLDKALKIIKDLVGHTYNVSTQNNTIKVTFEEKSLDEFVYAIIDQSIEMVRRRVDESGTLEPTILRQGYNNIVLELPDVSDPSKVKELLGKTAKLAFKLVKAGPFTNKNQHKGGLDTEVLPLQEDGEKSSGVYLAVDSKPTVKGDMLTSAKIGYDDKGNPVVNFSLNTNGAMIFADVTRNNVGRQLAIVLDGVIISAPNINGPIPGGSGMITGNFTVEKAADLALLLRSGALPAPLKVIEERVIGPDLGSDSIYQGSLATVIAIVAICIFMVLAYSLFGLFANVALVFNIILLMAVMSALGITLTLPGIAGIALTVGMAVDANVLIYERIKEEIRKGAKPAQSIEAGYNRAMPTIIDSNVTTIIGGVLMYYFGTGPVRGFAATLILGILISMFTAISLTKLINVWWLRRKRRVTIPI